MKLEMDTTDALALIHPDADEISGDEGSDASEHPEPTFEESTIESEIRHARTQLAKVVFYLNALSEAAAAASDLSTEKWQPFVDMISDKIMCALAFYRQYARSLTIKCRTTREQYQARNAVPSVEMAKLERMEHELEKMRESVEKLVSPDYSVFSDLKMVSPEELFRARPQLTEMSESLTGSDLEHFYLSQKMNYEVERRKSLMAEIESLGKKKRSLQDEVRRRKDKINVVYSEVEKVCTALGPIAEKLGLSLADLDRDFSALRDPLMEIAASYELNLEPTSSAPPSQAATPAHPSSESEEMAIDTLSPRTPAIAEEMAVDEEKMKEEGEASDEGEEEAAAAGNV